MSATGIGLREYFAAAGSTFTKADAEVIGPQIEALAEQGDVDEGTVIEVARSTNSPLHGYFEWDDAVAADKYRLGQAGTMLRAIRVRLVEDGRPRSVPAYRVARAATKPSYATGHNVLHGDSAAAVAKAKAALDELAGWRARYAPYVLVWKDFAQAFRQVTNQIGEAEDVLRGADLLDATDAALGDLAGPLEALREWQQTHGTLVGRWAEMGEQAGFLCQAIEDAASTFTTRLKAAERRCLSCDTPFHSGGPGNRLCERCARRRSDSLARIA